MQLCACSSFPAGELPQRLDALFQKLAFLIVLNPLAACGQQPQQVLVKEPIGLGRPCLQSLLKSVQVAGQLFRIR